jgi:hypothetical protein
MDAKRLPCGWQREASRPSLLDQATFPPDRVCG